MQIVKLQAENILRLQAVTIYPDSSTIEIKGENAAGKSSIMDSIIIGLKGKKFSPVEPVKHGSKRGKIVIEMSADPTVGLPAFTITSNVTNDKITTLIEPSELLQGETPRQFLDKLLGAISFDPCAFIEKEKGEQRKALLDVMGVDIDSLNKKEKELYDSRTIKGKEKNAAEAKLSSLQRFDDVTETEEVKISELSKKLTDAIRFNNDLDERVKINDELKKSGLENSQKIKEYQQQIIAIQQKIEELGVKIATQKEQFTIEKKALAEIEYKDLISINQEIATVEDKNTKIRSNREYDEQSIQTQLIKQDYTGIEANLESVRQEKVDLLKSAIIPVEGLTFSDECLLYHDIPFSQCSDGEKLMVSTGLSMALNPTVKIIRIKDGSLLGPKNLELLKQLVKDKGYQLFIEEVCGKDQYDQTGKIGIYITEGEISEVNGVPVSKESKAVKKGESKKKESNIVITDQDNVVVEELPQVNKVADVDDDW